MTITRAVETIIQAVSPEFNASAAKTEENGKRDRVAAIRILFTFIFLNILLHYAPVC